MTRVHIIENVRKKKDVSANSTFDALTQQDYTVLLPAQIAHALSIGEVGKLEEVDGDIWPDMTSGKSIGGEDSAAFEPLLVQRCKVCLRNVM